MGSKYFDNAATTPIKQEVLNSMMPYLREEFGNPSSIYTKGRSAKRAIEEARRKVAELINANPKEIIFTSGGSESDNTAIKGIAKKYRLRGNHIITSKVEHHAILNSCESLEKEGFEVTYLNVNKEGIINLEELKQAIKPNTILISIMYANNEIGTVQPISKIANIAKQNNIIFHTDAVQACGNVSIDVKKEGIDLLSMSSHKIYGPKGIGALYVKEGIEFENIIEGGHQEKGRRAGTENVAGIVGLGTACRLAKENINTHIKYLKKLRDYYIVEVQRRIPNVVLNGSIEQRLPGNANFSFKDVEGSTILLKLDERGFCASSGSACSTGNPNPSHVLTAIGLDSNLAKGALRVTFGENNTVEDVNSLLNNLEKIIMELRKPSSSNL